MNESYREGVASHTAPESCGATCESDVEALTGARAGRVFSRERTVLRDADAVRKSGRLHPTGSGAATGNPRRSTSSASRTFLWWARGCARWSGDTSGTTECPRTNRRSARVGSRSGGSGIARCRGGVRKAACSGTGCVMWPSQRCGEEPEPSGGRLTFQARPRHIIGCPWLQRSQKCHQVRRLPFGCG
jgi:hypothetical protein